MKSNLLAILATLFCIWLLRPLSILLGLVDRPSERKLHQFDVPLIGGIALFFGFSFALLTLNESLSDYRALLAGSALLLLTGIVDDFKNLSSKLRLVVQVIAALVLTAWGHIIINDIGNLFFMGNIHLKEWALPFTLFFVVANINAMNMIDGQDGLAGGILLGQAALLFFLANQLNLQNDAHILIIIIVLLIVFLAFNMRLPWRAHASIFLGDAGSTFLAFLMAWFAIHISQVSSSKIHPVTILWIMAFPLFDLVNVTLHRFYQGKSIMVASRDHFHHILHVAGINVGLSTLLLTMLSIGLGVLGIVLNYLHIHEALQFILFLFSLIIYFFIVALVRRG